MRRAILAASVLAFGALLAFAGAAAPPSPATAGKSAGDAPQVGSLRTLLEKELHWGMSHQEVIDVYNNPGGYFDREYAPQLGKLQPGVAMQEVEADRDNRKANFARGFSPFLDTPTGYDLTPIHNEYTYKNEEAVQPIFKDGKKRYFFYIKDRLWKVYDEIPLRADGPLGGTFQESVTKLNSLLGGGGRIRGADPAHDLELTTADWQDASSHLRAMDRSHEHLVAIVIEDKSTLNNLAALRSHKPTDLFAIDPSIAAVTKNGVTDPNAARGNVKMDAGAAKKH
jgi:hypothetical protein